MLHKDTSEVLADLTKIANSFEDSVVGITAADAIKVITALETKIANLSKRFTEANDK